MERKLLLAYALATSTAFAISDFLYQEYANNILVTSEQMVGRLDGSIRFEVGDRLIARDDFGSGFEAKEKARYFNRVLEIAKKHQSRVKIIKGGGNYIWMEPLDPKALQEATALLNWDGEYQTKIESMHPDFISVRPHCDETFLGMNSGYIAVDVMGKSYSVVGITNKADCESYSDALMSTWMEAIKRNELVTLSQKNGRVVMETIQITGVQPEKAKGPNAH